MVRQLTGIGLEQNLAQAVMNVNNGAKQILIVDDEADIRLLLSGLLRRLGHQPTCASFVEEGRQCLESTSFDVVFLDLNLPDGLGFDLLSTIKTGQRNAKVIMISAFDGQAERRKATEQGADYFIGKPFTRRSVEVALQTVQV